MKKTMVLAMLLSVINAHASYTCQGAFGKFTLEAISKNTFKSTLDGRLDGSADYNQKKNKLIYYVNNGCDNDMRFEVPAIVVETLADGNDPFTRFSMRVDYRDSDQIFLDTEVICTLNQ